MCIPVQFDPHFDVQRRGWARTVLSTCSLGPSASEFITLIKVPPLHRPVAEGLWPAGRRDPKSKSQESDRGSQVTVSGRKSSAEAELRWKGAGPGLS